MAPVVRLTTVLCAAASCIMAAVRLVSP